MDTVMLKIIQGQTPTNEELANVLYQICENHHSGSCDQCPVHECFKEELTGVSDCPVFKDGKAMLKAIKERKLP